MPVVELIKRQKNELQTGLLCLKPPGDRNRFDCVETLSPSGDLQEAERNVLPALRRLDSLDLDLIVVRCMPDAGIGRAINEKLLRSCAQSGTAIAESKIMRMQ
jgi:hypothetical protein